MSCRHVAVTAACSRTFVGHQVGPRLVSLLSRTAVNCPGAGFRGTVAKFSLFPSLHSAAPPPSSHPMPHVQALTLGRRRWRDNAVERKIRAELELFRQQNHGSLPDRTFLQRMWGVGRRDPRCAEPCLPVCGGGGGGVGGGGWGGGRPPVPNAISARGASMAFARHDAKRPRGYLRRSTVLLRFVSRSMHLSCLQVQAVRSCSGNRSSTRNQFPHRHRISR
jgi:hypothetical protein